MPAVAAYAAAVEAGRRAVALDPTDAEAVSALAFSEFYGLRLIDAGLARFEAALALEGNSQSLRDLAEAGDQLAATFAARTDALESMHEFKLAELNKLESELRRTELEVRNGSHPTRHRARDPLPQGGERERAG